MNKQELVQKIKQCTSAIEMLRMKENILEYLEEKKKKKEVNE